MADSDYPTWLDRVPPPEDVRRALRHSAQLPDQPGYLARADGDARFALWLRLADQHTQAATRETGRAPTLVDEQFPWRGAYISCWSPRGAAEAAHEGPGAIVLQALRQSERSGRPVTAPAPADHDVDLPAADRGPEL